MLLIKKKPAEVEPDGLSPKVMYFDQLLSWVIYAAEDVGVS
jgi:hypothetical protein